MSEEEQTLNAGQAENTSHETSKQEKVEKPDEYTPWYKKHGRFPTVPVNDIKDFLDSGGELDIYQLFAFRSIINPIPYHEVEAKLDALEDNYEIPTIDLIQSKFLNYWRDLLKCILCVLAVIISIVTLYFNMFDIVEESEREWCSMNGPIQPKLAAIIYTILLSTTFSSLLFQNQRAGFYWQLLQNYSGAFPSCHYNFISARILGFGRFMNLIVILNAFYLSCLIIFWSDSAIDIILNAVALLFIADIDNMLVTSYDCELLHDWFEGIGNQYFCQVAQMNECETKFWSALQIIGDALVKFSKFLMFAVPVWVAVCY